MFKRMQLLMKATNLIAVKEGEFRKVILRRPVFLESTKDRIEEELSDALKELIPFYETIYMNEVN